MALPVVVQHLCLMAANLPMPHPTPLPHRLLLKEVSHRKPALLVVVDPAPQANLRHPQHKLQLSKAILLEIKRVVHDTPML